MFFLIYRLKKFEVHSNYTHSDRIEKMLQNQILGELKWPAASLICTVFLFLFNSWMLYEEFFCFLSYPKKKYEVTVGIIIGLLGISDFIHIFCFY